MTANIKHTIFLHSAPRSGSTWLQNIFESHPQIITKYQPLFCYEFKNIINEQSTIEEFNAFLFNIFKSSNEFLNMTSAYHTESNDKIPKYQKSQINTLLAKNVHHHNLIETFIKLYPKIKIIGLVRNPCAVINSFIQNRREYKKEWIGTDEWLTGKRKNLGSEYFFGYNKWKKVIDIFENIKNKYPENIMIVQFENVLENPLKICDICRFIEIDVHANMFDFFKKSHLANPNNVSNASVIKNKSVRDKWKKILDPKIVSYIKKDIRGTIYEKYFL